MNRITSSIFAMPISRPSATDSLNTPTKSRSVYLKNPEHKNKSGYCGRRAVIPTMDDAYRINSVEPRPPLEGNLLSWSGQQVGDKQSRTVIFDVYASKTPGTRNKQLVSTAET